MLMETGMRMAAGHRHTGVMWQAMLEPFRRRHGSPQPLQAQIRQMLVAAILDGVLPPDTYLPSTRELAQVLGVSRNTVIIVYQRLCDEGYLESRSREGFRVVDGGAAVALPGAQATMPADDVQPLAGERDARPDWEARLRLPPSQQRNIQKRSDWRRYPYPFLYGQFDADSFPMAAWRQCCLRTLSALEANEWGHDMLLHDDASLIQQIRSRVLPQRGIQAAEDNILLTVGSQHGLYLLADLLLDHRSHVGVEEPGYPDARNIFLRRGARLLPMRVDEHGLVMSGALRQCDYVHVTPSHQCPTTVRMSIERRRALLEAAHEQDFVVIEDDYEADSNWHGETLPALKSLDRHDRVIYLGSFSKSFAPGLRLGYVVGPAQLVQEMRAMRRLNLRHPNTFMQRALGMFMAMGHYHRLQRRLSSAHAARAAAVMEAMSRHLPMCRVQPSQGGSALWVEAPAGFDSRALAERAEQQGVLIEAGDVFFMEPGSPCRCFRLGFTSIAQKDIEPGIRRLASVFFREFP